MQIPPFILLAASAVAWPYAGALPASAPQGAGTVKIEKHTLDTTSGDTIHYELGTLFVRENRSDPKSRIIGVGFARFRADKQPPEAPPIFQLPGGPGSSFLSGLKKATGRQRDRIAQRLSRFRQISDVVIVDQRGFSERGDVLLLPIQIPARPTDRAPTTEDHSSHVEKFLSWAKTCGADNPSMSTVTTAILAVWHRAGQICKPTRLPTLILSAGTRCAIGARIGQILVIVRVGPP